jgi:hypothetical protein
MTDNPTKKMLTAEDAAAILSETLQEVAERRTTLRRALVVSRLAVALAKTIEMVDLRERIEYLEQMMKKRKP